MVAGLFAGLIGAALFLLRGDLPWTASWAGRSWASPS
jgi:hypothetical protein